MLGHHIAETGDGIPRTLWLADEASGVEDISYERASTWARRMLIIGNCYSGAPGCSFFQKAVQGGVSGAAQRLGQISLHIDPSQPGKISVEWDSQGA